MLISGCRFPDSFDEITIIAQVFYEAFLNGHNMFAPLGQFFVTGLIKYDPLGFQEFLGVGLILLGNNN